MTRLTAAAVAGLALLLSHGCRCRAAALHGSYRRDDGERPSDVGRVRHGRAAIGRPACTERRAGSVAAGATGRASAAVSTRACRSLAHRSFATRTPAWRNPSSARCRRPSRSTRVRHLPRQRRNGRSSKSAGGTGDTAAPDRVDDPADRRRRAPPCLHHSRIGVRQRCFASSSTPTLAPNCCASPSCRRSRPIGTGRGLIGDTKKLSVRSLAGAFVADDRLRPPSLTDLRHA